MPKSELMGHRPSPRRSAGCSHGFLDLTNTYGQQKERRATIICPIWIWQFRIIRCFPCYKKLVKILTYKSPSWLP